jgi:ligand-binding sensor domain-containing protein
VFPALLRLVVVLVCCAGSGTGIAQRHALDEPRFTRIGDAESINDGVVTALAEDADGFVWIGTTVGLVRHDGYQLRPYPVGGAAEGRPAGSRFVRSLLAAADGGLWVGMEGEGLAHFDPHGERWTLHAPDTTRPGALRHGTVRALARAADGTLWVGTAGGGLHRLAPGSRQFERPGSVAEGTLPDDRVYALLIDRRGQLWIGTWQGLVRMRPEAGGRARFEPVFSTPGNDGLAGRPVTMLGEGPDGQIWVGTRDGALALVDPADGRGRWIENTRSTEDDALAGPGGSASFAQASADEVWIGRDRALDLRDAATGELRQRLRRQPHKPWGLGGHNVVALLRDAAGQLWVGSYGGGLQRHHPTAGLWVRRGEGPDGSPFAEGDVRSLHAMANGEIWAGTPEGAVLVFDRTLALRERILPQPTRRSLRFAGGLVGAITQSADGTVWVGSDSGIHAFGPDRRLLARHGMGGVRTRRLLAAADGSVWAATQDGVHRLTPVAASRGARFVRVLRDDGQPLAGNVNALVQAADGTVFVGGNTGLYRAAPGSPGLQPVPAEAGAGLGSQVVLGLLLDRQGQLWVDTNAGLHRWRRPAEAVARFEAVAAPPTREGAAAGSVGANLLEDTQGRIWTHQLMHDPRDGSVHALGPADGADIGTGWFRAYTALPDGRLLFGGSTGILVIEPDRVRRWRYAPPWWPPSCASMANASRRRACGPRSS